MITTRCRGDLDQVATDDTTGEQIWECETCQSRYRLPYNQRPPAFCPTELVDNNEAPGRGDR